MTMKINSSLPVDQLAKNQLEKMQACEGWHDSVSSEEAHARLQGQPPFTYLLTVGQRQDGSTKDVYKLVWVTPERLVEEKMIFLDYDFTGPYFRNCINDKFPNGVMSDTDKLDEGLLSKIMQCDSYRMTPLKNVFI